MENDKKKNTLYISTINTLSYRKMKTFQLFVTTGRQPLCDVNVVTSGCVTYSEISF